MRGLRGDLVWDFRDVLLCGLGWLEVVVKMVGSVGATCEITRPRNTKSRVGF